MDAYGESLVLALTVLQQGTAADFAGQREEAVELYTAAMSQLESVAPMLPAELGETVRRNVEEVRRKTEGLRRTREAKAVVAPFPRFPIEFVSIPLPPEEYAVPREPFSRVFWLMRSLERSIGSGAYLAPGLYVSKDVWMQEGGAGALKHIAAKIKYLAALCEAMDPLRSMTTLGVAASTRQQLQKFIDAESVLRDTLDYDTGKRDAKAQKKSVWDAFSRKAKNWRQQEGNLELCLTWAVNALEQGQLFERWWIYHTQTAATAEVNEIKTQLTHISRQLYTGICQFLLQDAAVLIQRYQDKCAKSSVKLLPLELKLDGDGPSK